MDAYTLYLRGRVAFDRGDVAAYSEAQRDFEQALALDPAFAPAAEGVLLSYINKVYSGAVSSNPRPTFLSSSVMRLGLRRTASKGLKGLRQRRLARNS